MDQIRLIYSGKQLADDKRIEESVSCDASHYDICECVRRYNIVAGGTIHMVLQLRGGGEGECGSLI